MQISPHACGHAQTARVCCEPESPAWTNDTRPQAASISTGSRHLPGGTQWLCMQSSDRVTQSVAVACKCPQHLPGQPVFRGARRAPGAGSAASGKTENSRFLRKNVCRPESLTGAWRSTWLHTWALCTVPTDGHLQAPPHLGVPLKAPAAAVSGPVGHRARP